MGTRQSTKIWVTEHRLLRSRSAKALFEQLLLHSQVLQEASVREEERATVLVLLLLNLRQKLFGELPGSFFGCPFLFSFYIRRSNARIIIQY
jgi:hypothetical protein